MKKLDKEFLRLEEAAEMVHCSIRHLQEEVKRGHLRAYKPAKFLLFTEEDLRKWMKCKAVS